MTSTTPQSLFDSKGSQLTIGKKIGSGGEGDVFEISSADQKFVAKIYHKSVDTQKQEKLQSMVQGCTDDLKNISAWPIDLIYKGKNGPICGFLMPKISDYVPIHKLYGPSHRKQLFPNVDWNFLIRAAKNVAAAFYVIHKYGYVIGDVNEGNILVNNQACVKLIDCDSFQIRTKTNIIYCCEVGVAQFTPPEIQNSKNFKSPRIPNNDNFGLAILIFQLLFMGRHPYSGVYHGKGDMPIEKAIAEYRFAFGKTSQLKLMSPPPNSVDITILPNEMSDLFEQAFTEKGVQIPYRPSAKKWAEALHNLEKQIRICNLELIHKFYSGLSFCPWCKLESTSGILFFLGSNLTLKFDLNIEWQKVTAIKPPGSIPNINPKNYNFQPEPIPEGLEKALKNRKIRQISGVLIVIVGLLINILLLIPAILIAIILFVYRGKEFEELARREKNFDTIRNNWVELNNKWKKEASDEDFKNRLNRLLILKRNYETIEKEYQNTLASLKNTVRERQLKNYLENCFIDSSNIAGIGLNRKATLRSFGIETAADIQAYKIRSIPGFGDTLTNKLVLWRQQMEKQFRFDPSKGIDKSDIQLLNQKFQPRMKPIEREFRYGVENLKQIQINIFKNRSNMQNSVEKCAKELAQAHSNLKPFQLLNIGS